jgi:uncharacterized membrane protein
MLSSSSARRSAAVGAFTIAGSLLVAVPADGAPSSPAPAYTLTVLSPPGAGDLSFANGLNDAGLVTGTARTTTESRPQFATSWSGATPTNLGGLPDATFSRAFDINADGISVGEAFTPTPEASRAVAFTPEGVVPVGSLNASGSGVANDINDRGQVTGVSYNGTYSRAFLGRIGKIAELPTPDIDDDVTTTRGNAVSQRGDVAGASFVVHEHGDHTHTVAQATLWSGFEATLLAGSEEDLASHAYGLNDAGLVVGEESDGTDWHATVWRDGEIERLAGIEGLRHARAQAVNGSGDIVGHATGFYGNSSFNGLAMLWRDGQAIDLNTQIDLPEGFVLRNATDINEQGVIVGSVSTPDGTRAVRLDPRETSESHLEVDDVRTTYGTPAEIPVEVHSDGPTDGQVALVIDGRERGTAEVDEQGRATLTTPERLRPGSYQATVTYSGTAGTAASEASVTLRVNRARPVVALAVKAGAARATIRATVSIPGSTVTPTGYVAVRLKSKGERVLRLVDGRAKAVWRGLAPGRYRVVARMLATELTTTAQGAQRFRVTR